MIDHLFFECLFARDCWNNIHFQWDASLILRDILVRGKQVHPFDFFPEVVKIATWELWKLRNHKIFNINDLTPARWLSCFKKNNVVFIWTDLNWTCGQPLAFG
jgi:hypothetical protein